MAMFLKFEKKPNYLRVPLLYEYLSDANTFSLDKINKKKKRKRKQKKEERERIQYSFSHRNSATRDRDRGSPGRET